VSPWRQLKRGLRALTRRSAADDDLGDEVAHYLEQTVAANMARGMSAEEARRAAQLECGNTTVVRERVRDYGWENRFDTFFADVRFAARRLRTQPGFTTVAVLTLALGIGASTAIFSAVNPILFETLPYPDARRIVTVADMSAEGTPVAVAYGNFRELSLRAKTFEAMAVVRSWEPTIDGWQASANGAAEPEQLDGLRVSAPYFRVLGVLPALGRDFLDDEDRLRGPPSVIITDALWRRRFNANPALVGRPITSGGAQYTVVGILPPNFEHVIAPSIEIFTLLQYDNSLPPNGREWGHHLTMVARVRGSVTIDQARRELAAIAQHKLAEFPRVPWASMERGFVVSTLQDTVTGGVKPALLSMLAAVLLLLTIACVNVTNLLLARGVQRRGEFAMRVALGAGRTRLLRQLLTESLVLALAGGLLGMFVAAAGVRALVALSPPGLPRADAVHLDFKTFGFTLAITSVIGIIVGIIPALHASRGQLQPGLQGASRRLIGGHRFTRATLVVTEVALALVLLIGSGLLLRSLRQVLSLAPGFASEQLIALKIQVAGPQFNDDARTHRYFSQALDAVHSVRGVTGAAFTSLLPLGGDEGMYGVHFESSPTGPKAERGTFRYAGDASYTSLMGIALLRGRRLDARDVLGAPPSVLISESLARAKFPGQDPLGQRLRIGAENSPWFTVVGVVGDVKQTSLSASEPSAVYVIDRQQTTFADRTRWIVARTSGDPAALTAAIKRAIWSVDGNQPIVRATTMRTLVAESVAQRRFALMVAEVFALAALVLAAAGIYGVLSGAVVERTREIGVRAALGATQSSILALVLRQGFGLTAFGVAVGLAGAAFASRAITSMLFGVSPLDVITYVGVVVLLGAVSLVACAVPAWRASRVDPMTTLRVE
jgi:putative ABC transport system permease protein